MENESLEEVMENEEPEEEEEVVTVQKRKYTGFNRKPINRTPKRQMVNTEKAIVRSSSRIAAKRGDEEMKKMKEEKKPMAQEKKVRDSLSLEESLEQIIEPIKEVKKRKATKGKPRKGKATKKSSLDLSPILEDSKDGSSGGRRRKTRRRRRRSNKRKTR